MNPELEVRSGNACELCQATDVISVYTVPPTGQSGNEIAVCGDCRSQIERQQPMNSAYWHFLAETIWSPVPAIQVVAWRMLTRLKSESWAAECLDIMYMDQQTLEWAMASPDDEPARELILHRDINGNALKNGDTVVLTRSLDIRGSSVNARMGTVIRNIRVVEDNPAQIEGKIDGQLIVILTKYLRRHA